MHQAHARQDAIIDNGFAHVQVLKKRPPSQAVDETQWETFVTKYLNPSYWKSWLVLGLAENFQHAVAGLDACVDNGFAHVQVLKRHPASQAVDETLWEAFIARYLNLFY